MDTSLGYVGSATGTGYDIYHKPFWKLVLDQWEEQQDQVAPAVLYRSFPTERLLPAFYEGMKVLLRGEENRAQYVFCRDDEGRLFSFGHHEYDHLLELQLYSPAGMDDAHKRMDAMKAIVPPMEDKGEKWINVAFWSLAPNGSATYQDRYITAAKWEDVKINYPTTTDRGSSSIRDSLETMHAWEQPPDSRGRLLLLHGPAGTGKTNALASLARSWKEWCSIHYVVDPDNFFHSAHYMMSVLMNTGNDLQRPNQWRLIVVEDADELLTTDAKQRKGQDVSRLLNLCDGLVGQGMRVLVLITTNEEVGKMHPAITRPGRCVANLAIGTLSVVDADAWRAAHGLKPWGDQHRNGPERAGQAGSATLAALYEELAQSQVVAGNVGPRRIGF